MSADTSIAEHGARSGTGVVTQAIQAAIDHAAREGRGRVRIPSGAWVTGTLHLRDGVELHLEPDAALLGSLSLDDYPASFPADRVPSRRAFDRRLVLGDHCRDIAITGAGCIDGRHGCPDGGIRQGEGRPLLVQLIGCRGVRMEDVELRNAGSWMQQILWCHDVRMSRMRVWNHGNFTNDGLDIDGSENVTVEDCRIDSHDDALVFKSTGSRACRHIRVRGCELRTHCHGIKFGTESIGGFENIEVAGCRVLRSAVRAELPGHPDGRPPITGCALECTDGGSMRGIRIVGLHAEPVLAPFLIKLGNRHHTLAGSGDAIPAGEIADIEIAEVQATMEGLHTASVTGYPGRPVRGVRLRDLDLSYAGGCTAEEILDEVPERSDGYPEINMFQKGADRQLPAWGLYARHVEGLMLNRANFRVRAEDARDAIVRDGVSGWTARDVMVVGGGDNARG